MDRSGCLIVVPPVAATDPKLRLHRSRQRVSLRLGPIAVSGAAHTPAGTEATGFLRRHARAFIPLTDVSISSPADASISANVAIVHLALAERFEPVSGTATPR